MNDLTTLPNIGKELSALLEQAGINNGEELRNTGSEKAFIRLSAVPGCEPCINKLYALEGAVQGIRWHSLDAGRKLELKAFFQQMKK